MTEKTTKYKAILAHEQALAKTVALKLRAQRPQATWQLFVPFRFIAEFFSAKRDMQAFAEGFTFVRKIALDSARWMAGSEELQERTADMEIGIRKWLTSRDAYSDEMLEAQVSIAGLLLEHYSRLLEAEGDSYPALLRNAYQGRPAVHELWLRKLTEAENKADRALVSILGGDEELATEMQQKQAALYDLRTREIREVFA
jgi:hypothetical protein